MITDNEVLKEIEDNATQWYNHQPMGSAPRANGPAAIQGYMAGAAGMHIQMRDKFEELESTYKALLEKRNKEIKTLKEQSTAKSAVVRS